MQRQTILLAAAATLVLPAAALAQTLDLPPRKAVLWELTTTFEKPRSLPPMATQMCLDAATDRDLMENVLKLGKCRNLTTRRQGQTYVIDADCQLGSVAGKSKAVISGDFGSAYTVRMEGTTEGVPGAGKGPQPMLMTQAAKWKSADCPGMRPGDITMFGGIKVNIKQMKSLPPGLLR